MKLIPLPPVQRLRELLNYDPETGVLTWNLARRKCTRGAVAGRVTKGQKYRRIMLDGIRYYAHRVAWCYVNGVDPKDQIDHRNLQYDDNRIDNLREATNAENHQNMRVRTDSLSGITGVRWTRNAWQTDITTNGKVTYLGRFSRKEDAEKAYLTAKVKHHPFAAEVPHACIRGV